jgi:hypothetical protein
MRDDIFVSRDIEIVKKISARARELIQEETPFLELKPNTGHREKKVEITRQLRQEFHDFFRIAQDAGPAERRFFEAVAPHGMVWHENNRIKRQRTRAVKPEAAQAAQLTDTAKKVGKRYTPSSDTVQTSIFDKSPRSRTDGNNPTDSGTIIGLPRKRKFMSQTQSDKQSFKQQKIANTDKFLFLWSAAKYRPFLIKSFEFMFREDHLALTFDRILQWTRDALGVRDLAENDRRKDKFMYIHRKGRNVPIYDDESLLSVYKDFAATGKQNFMLFVEDRQGKALDLKTLKHPETEMDSLINSMAVSSVGDDDEARRNPQQPGP